MLKDKLKNIIEIIPDYLEKEKIEILNNYKNILFRELPEGSKSPIDGYPSIRLHGTRIRKSIKTNQNAVYLDHPNPELFEYLTFGTRKHTISGNEDKPLVFWLGSPLKWKPRKGKTGARKFLQVVHPGFKPKRNAFYIANEKTNEALEALTENTFDLIERILR